MNNWLLIVMIAMLAAATAAFVWVALKLGKTPEPVESLDPALFTDEMREEMRTHGRQLFEKVINENVASLQKDMSLTAKQVNELIHGEMTRLLQQEFAKTREAIEQQRAGLVQRLEGEIQTEKQRRLERFDQNMAETVNHYVMAAIGNQIDLNDQLDFIISELQANKTAIMEDLRNGS